MVTVATRNTARLDLAHEELTTIAHLTGLSEKIGWEAALARIKRVATEACDDIEAGFPD